MSLIKRIGIGAASAGMFAAAISPVYAALEILDNGPDSTNVINAETTNTNIVQQTNVEIVLTDASSTASTGGNTANGNTGSGVTVTSGNATATTTVTVGGSSNLATAAPPCGCAVPPDVKIADNGKDSTNVVNADSTNVSERRQRNFSVVATKASAKAKTGKNKANGNTGGTITVTSGDATASASVTRTPPSNILIP